MPQRPPAAPGPRELGYECTSSHQSLAGACSGSTEAAAFCPTVWAGSDLRKPSCKETQLLQNSGCRSDRARACARDPGSPGHQQVPGDHVWF